MRRFADTDKRATWGIKPRCCLDLQTPAEGAIRDAVSAVERAGGHPMLTDVVVLLGHALDRLGEYIDDVEPNP